MTPEEFAAHCDAYASKGINKPTTYNLVGMTIGTGDRTLAKVGTSWPLLRLKHNVLENNKEEIFRLRVEEKRSLGDIIETLDLQCPNQRLCDFLIKHKIPKFTPEEEREASNKTMMRRYGTKQAMQVEEFKQKHLDTARRTRSAKKKLKTTPGWVDSTQYYVYVLRRPDPTEKSYNLPFYVGKGSGQRARQHFGEAARHEESNHHKANTIRKYLTRGLEPIIELFECSDEEAAYQLETDLIAKFGRASDGGILTNIKRGGTGGGDSNSRPVDQYDLFGKYLQTFPSAADAARSLGESPDKGDHILKAAFNRKYAGKRTDGLKSALGFIWVPAGDEIDLSMRSRPPVYQFNSEKELIGRYYSAGEAIRQIGSGSSPYITRLCRSSNTHKKYLGFYWSFYESIDQASSVQFDKLLPLSIRKSCC